MQRITTCISEYEIKGRIVSVYCDYENPETHLTGYIYAYNEEYMIVQHISPSGYYDGYILIRTNDILRIDFDGKYEQKVEYLYKYKRQSHPEFKILKDMRSSVLDYASRNHVILSVELQDDFLTGYLKDYNDELLCLQLVDKWGCADGEAIIINSEIISIAVDTISEQDIRIMYESIYQNSLDNK